MAHSFIGRSCRVFTRLAAPSRMHGYLRPAGHARHPTLTRHHVRSQENTRRITQRSSLGDITVGHRTFYIIGTTLRIALPLRLVQSGFWMRSCWSRHRLLRPSILVRIQGQIDIQVQGSRRSLSLLYFPLRVFCVESPITTLIDA